MWSFSAVGGDGSNANGANPYAGLFSDAAGDLFGTTYAGGADGGGTVFELVNTGTVSNPAYSNPTTLWSFTGGTAGTGSASSLISDAAGDLFGTTSGIFGGGDGTVFEFVNTGSVSSPVYGTLTTLWSFSGGGGAYPSALISDAAGDLFGTTFFGGPGQTGHGTVFELVNNGSASSPIYTTPTTLYTFTGGNDGGYPIGSLFGDAAGNLFGTTGSFGAYDNGTVFELVNSGTVSSPVYGSLTTLWSFTGGDDGRGSDAGLISDAAGDLFGTTPVGGPGDGGTVFELVNSGTLSSPVYGALKTLWTFAGDGPDLSYATASLMFDSAGNLLGTTAYGGSSGDGTVFELVNIGTSVGNPVYADVAAVDQTTSVINYDPIVGTVAGQTTTSEAPVAPFSSVTITDLHDGGTDIDTLSITLTGGGGTLTDGAGFTGTSTLSGSGNSYTLTGTAADITSELDALSFTPTAGGPHTTSTTTFTLVNTNPVTGPSPSDSTTTVANTDPGVAPTIIGTQADQTSVWGPVTPFSGVTIIDTNPGATDTLSITLTGGDGALADGAGFTGTSTLTGSGNSYTLSGTAADITAELDALVFTPASTGPTLTSTTNFTLRDTSIDFSVTATFTGTNGASPHAGLVSDAAGNLFGTTATGGANDAGTVFELVNSGSVSSPVYSDPPTTLYSFTGVGSDGANPYAGLLSDASGNLFGTTEYGGADGIGTIFELVNDGSGGYTEQTLYSFAGDANTANPVGGLISDAAGDLFGTTQYSVSAFGSPRGPGTVFELVNTGTVSNPIYSSTLTTLWSFSFSEGSNPLAGVISDPAGDLFGTTQNTGAYGWGTVFELVNTGTVSNPVYSEQTLYSFSDNSDSGNPYSGLIRDAAGNLFGTTEGGNTYGSVFELVNSGSVSSPVYTTLTKLWSFTGGDDGRNPEAGLISDAAGDLFGTTSRGGTNGGGTVFELVNSGTASNPDYSGTPITLWSFTGGNDGQTPLASLSFDAAGDLLGTASGGGAGSDGTVFELANVGTLSNPVYVNGTAVDPTTSVIATAIAPTITGTVANQTTRFEAPIAPFSGVTITDHNVGATDTLSITVTGGGGALADGAGFTGTSTLTGSGNYYTLTGTAADITSELDALSFTPTAGAPGATSTTNFTSNTLVSFNGTNGESPYYGSLIRNAAGDLFGTTEYGGANDTGTVFELVNIGSVSSPVYSGTPTTLWSFTDGNDGGYPYAGLFSDAAGNLFGTTEYGGAGGAGTVFELVNSGSVSNPIYSNAPTTLYSFTGGNDGGYPYAGLISDAAGDLFGTTSYDGANGDGTVFELVNSGSVSSPVYGTLTTLWSFTGGTDGSEPESGLTSNAAGDLFGTTYYGGANNAGAVFELVNSGTASSPIYSGTPTTVWSFIGGSDGGYPVAGLISDAAGDLFGTTPYGGDTPGPYGYGLGTVFELVNVGTASSPVYSTSTTLWSFTGGSDGDFPYGPLIRDAAGDLFGTTEYGGTSGYGTVFELVNNGTASSPVYGTLTTLWSFTYTGSDGAYPYAGLTIDAAGNLFGTTESGGTSYDGTVFELVNSGTVSHPVYTGGATVDPTTSVADTTLCFAPGTHIRTPAGEIPVETLKRGDLVLTTEGRAAPVTWIGRQTVSTRFGDPLRVLPIRICAGALAENVPCRDLLVTPDHALLVDDVLVQAGALVNGTSIVRERNVPERVTYYHVELDDHSLLLAENTPAETFVDNVDRLAFDNWAEHEALYPDGKPILEMPYPRAKAHRQIPQAIKHRLEARAAGFCEALAEVA